jgi:hypothetical protein
VSIRSLGLFRERTQVQLQRVRRHRESCDLDDGLGQKFIGCRDLGKQDACLGGLHGSYTVGATDT